MSQPNTVSVNILDKEYQVACPAEQEDALRASARYLDKQMRDIRDSGKVIGLERIAVMAALNISHELLRASEAGAPVPAPNTPELSLTEVPNDNELRGLNRKLDDALYSLRQLEIS